MTRAFRATEEKDWNAATTIKLAVEIIPKSVGISDVIVGIGDETLVIPWGLAITTNRVKIVLSIEASPIPTLAQWAKSRHVLGMNR